MAKIVYQEDGSVRICPECKSQIQSNEEYCSRCGWPKERMEAFLPKKLPGIFYMVIGGIMLSLGLLSVRVVGVTVLELPFALALVGCGLYYIDKGKKLRKMGL